MWNSMDHRCRVGHINWRSSHRAWRNISRILTSRNLSFTSDGTECLASRERRNLSSILMSRYLRSTSNGTECLASRERRNLSSMSRHLRFTSHGTEYFASSKRREPGHRTCWSRVCWSISTHCPFRDSGGRCFSPSSVRRRRRKCLSLLHCLHFFSHFVHLSLHGCHLLL